jgi:hypothetical protein
MAASGLSSAQIEALLSPKDPMNVPSALRLCEALAACSSVQADAQLQHALLAVKLVGAIGASLCCILDAEPSLEEQLTQLSQLGHLVAFLAYGADAPKSAFLPPVLVHDIQTVVRNAYFMAAKVRLRAVQAESQLDGRQAGRLQRKEWKLKRFTLPRR